MVPTSITCIDLCRCVFESQRMTAALIAHDTNSPAPLIVREEVVGRRERYITGHTSDEVETQHHCTSGRGSVVMNPSRFGIFTFGNVFASIT